MSTHDIIARPIGNGHPPWQWGSDPLFSTAGEHYKGVLYRLIAKARREGRWLGDLQVAIISAKYGFLLEETKGVAFFDQKMDTRRALALQDEIGLDLDAFLQCVLCQEVCRFGVTYRPRSRPLEELLREYACVWEQG